MATVGRIGEPVTVFIGTIPRSWNVIILRTESIVKDFLDLNSSSGVIGLWKCNNTPRSKREVALIYARADLMPERWGAVRRKICFRHGLIVFRSERSGMIHGRWNCATYGIFSPWRKSCTSPGLPLCCG